MLKYTTSTNIERDVVNDINYITTPNSLEVFERIIQGYKSGYHSFNIIGSYGTGKSSFLWALEKNLADNKAYFAPLNGQFNGVKKFEFVKLVGESRAFAKALKEKFNLETSTSDNTLLKTIKEVGQELAQNYKKLFLIVDEFGKFLEYASRNNPEKSLYFIQQLSELANDPNSNIIFITTLHQNFSSYSKGLSRIQRKEWEKVKGRLIDISFDEPVEQLLFLASKRLEDLNLAIKNPQEFEILFTNINESKLIVNTTNLDYEVSKKLYPLDFLSAHILTESLQRYGQNERSLFMFLSSNRDESISHFNQTGKTVYSVADVFDYLTKNLSSELEDKNTNPHKPIWRATLTALDKVDALNTSNFEELSKIIKCIALINIFSKPLGKLDRDFLNAYTTYALEIKNADVLIDRLIEQRIIKFFNHKNKYFFIDGTDIDIEDELLKASAIVSPSIDIKDRLQYYIDLPILSAKSIYYRKGTPRLFKFQFTNDLETKLPKNELDGSIYLITNEEVKVSDVLKVCAEEKPNIFVLLKNLNQLRNSLFEIEKLDYVIKKFADDKAAKLLLTEEKRFETSKLEVLLDYDLFDSSKATWFYNGSELNISSKAVLNQTLSRVAERCYPNTPIYINEMVNKEHLTTPVLTARKNLLKDLLEYAGNYNLGYENDKFPPQKTIYLSLINETGIHREENGHYYLGAPVEESFQPLWEHCIIFLEDSKVRKRNINALYESLAEPPIKLKKGFIEFWVPIFLIIKNEDYALFHKDEGYIPYLTSEVLDLIHKKPTNYELKTYQVEGLNLNLLNKYKEITGLQQDDSKLESSLIAVFSRFMAFYRGLPQYAKTTNRLSPSAKGMRDAIAKAKDPETALLIEIPKGLGYKELNLIEGSAEILRDFIMQLNEAIYEIRTSYDNLLNRFEKQILTALGIKETDFSKYKAEIQKRFEGIKPHLLLPKEKTLINRISSKLDDRASWLKSLGDTILTKGINQIRDEEEILLLDNTAKILTNLENLVELHKLKEDRKEDEILQFQITQTDGKTHVENLIISQNDQKELVSLEKELEALLGKNKSLRKAALVRLLQKGK